MVFWDSVCQGLSSLDLSSFLLSFKAFSVRKFSQTCIYRATIGDKTGLYIQELSYRSDFANVPHLFKLKVSVI